MKPLFTIHAESTLLHRISSSTSSGYPYAGLVQDTAGNLYGTTTLNGGGYCCGTVFRLIP